MEERQHMALANRLAKRLRITLKNDERLTSEDASSFEQRLAGVWLAVLNPLSVECLQRLSKPSHQKTLMNDAVKALTQADLTDMDELEFYLGDALVEWQEAHALDDRTDSGSNASRSGDSGTPSHSMEAPSGPTPEPRIYDVLKDKGRLVKKGHLTAIREGEYTQSEKPLAEGSFGAVYRGTWSGFEVAIKQLKTGQSTDALLKELKREALLLAKLSSPYVVHLHGVCFQYPYRMILEYCAGGSLFQLLQSTQPVRWEYRWQIGRDIAEGLAYIHAQGIVHADLAARNILLTYDGRAKLTDFGLSEVKSYIQFSATSQQYVQPKEEQKIPWAWTAPEVLQGKEFTTASDTYSFGTVLWELSSRKLPYRGTYRNAHQRSRIQAEIKRGARSPMSHRDEHNQVVTTVPPQTPNVWVKLMQACWSLKSEERPRAVEAAAQLTIGQWQGWGFTGSVSQDTQADATIAQLQSNNVQLQQQVVTVQQQSQQWHSQVSQLQGTYQHLQSQFTQECQAHEQTRNELQGAKKTLGYQEKQLVQLEQTLAHKETELSSQSEINRVLSEEQRKQQSALEEMADQMKARDRSVNHIPRVASSPTRDGTTGGSSTKGRAAAHVTEVSKKTSEELDAKSSPRGQFKEELSALFKYVVEGHLDEVDERLKRTPALALCQSDVEDLSGRTFKQITVFQYAAWALDADMWDIILNYLDSQEAATQLSALEQDRTDIIQAYGAHYSLDALINHYETYIKNYDQWDADQCTTYWCKEIGGAQRMCPAWYIYAMCEPGKDAAWVKQDISRGFNRAYDMKYGLTWWMTTEYWGGKLGYKWAAARWVSGVTPMAIEGSTECDSLFHLTRAEPFQAAAHALHAGECTQQCKTQVGKRLGTLKQQLGVGLTQSSQGKGFGQ